MRIASIDQGTTSTRILVVDREGRGKVVHAARHAQHHPHPGFVEHDPEELIRHMPLASTIRAKAVSPGMLRQARRCRR